MYQKEPTVYLIRHGEKPPKDKHGEDPPGLSEEGLERAKALVHVFGKDSKYNIGLIIAQKPQKAHNKSATEHEIDEDEDNEHYGDEKHGHKHHHDKHRHKHHDDDDDISQDRPWKTVEPLAQSLEPYGCQIDHSIGRDKTKRVKHRIENFEGIGNVLVCWEHNRLTDIARKLGVRSKHGDKSYPEYPDDRYDIIWTIEYPYHKINEWTSEHVPGLDDNRDDKAVAFSTAS